MEENKVYFYRVKQKRDYYTVPLSEKIEKVASRPVKILAGVYDSKQESLLTYRPVAKTVASCGEKATVLDIDSYKREHQRLIGEDPDSNYIYTTNASTLRYFKHKSFFKKRLYKRFYWIYDTDVLALECVMSKWISGFNMFMNSKYIFDSNLPIIDVDYKIKSFLFVPHGCALLHDKVIEDNLVLGITNDNTELVSSVSLKDLSSIQILSPYQDRPPYNYKYAFNYSINTKILKYIKLL